MFYLRSEAGREVHCTIRSQDWPKTTGANGIDMDAQNGCVDAGRASLRRAVNMLLAVVLLTQPGCMCGCSSSQRTACLSTECDGSGSLCAAHDTIGFHSSKGLDFMADATDVDLP